MQTKTMRILTGKRIKKMQAELGMDLSGYLFLESNDKIWITSRKMEEIDFDKLDLKSIGMFFAQVKNSKTELTKEGKKLFGL